MKLSEYTFLRNVCLFCNWLLFDIDFIGEVGILLRYGYKRLGDLGFLGESGVVLKLSLSYAMKSSKGATRSF